MRTPLGRSRSIALACTVLVAASCGGTVGSNAPSVAGSAPAAGGAPTSAAAGPTMPWPAPPNPLELTVEAGLEPAPQEYMANHVHSHLDVFVDGEEITVPAGIGINIEDPEVIFFEDVGSYAGIEMCDQPCISPLHTHDETGVLHTESRNPCPTPWVSSSSNGVSSSARPASAEHCDPTPIAVYIDGEPYEGDPRAIELTDEKVIVIAIGTPPEVIPSTYDFSNA